VIARVKIRINQDAVLSRDAFEGTFVLENLDPSIDLSAIDIDLKVYDLEGNLVTDRFAITSPTLFGFGGALDGSGSLAAASSGTAVYTILAKDTAAPIEATQYSIGGRVRYNRGAGVPTSAKPTSANESIDFNLAPATITVLPQPVLAFNYFLQRDVFSDDPFTSAKEASQPYVLGLLAHNRGYGVANDLIITSAQPEIIDNQLGLKIAFELIGAAVNGLDVLPSLSVDLGDLAAHSTSEAHWLMTSTLQGRFIDYNATFEYINALGLKDVPGLSQLIDVNLHELTRRVRDHRPDADSRHDYLVNSNPPVVGQNNSGKDLLPDILYLSNDTTESVTAMVSGAPGLAISTISFAGEASLTVTAAAGWTYLRLLEPSAGNRPITAIRRADGSLVSSDNFWTTDRTFPENGPPTYESSLHLLDFNPAGGPTTYTVVFGAPTSNTAPSVVVTLADQQAKEAEPFFYIVPSTSFLDIDTGDSLSYSARREDGTPAGAPLPTWLTFNPSARSFSGTPSAADVTTLSVRVTATDQGGLSVSDTFSLTVEPANYAPIVSTPIPDQTISTGVAWTYTLPAASFSDPNPADTLTYTARIDDGTASGAPLPAWLTFDPLSRSFSGTPADADASTLPVRITATDPAGASISDTFNLIVSDTAGPSITGITVAGTQLQVQFSEPIVTTGLVASRFAATVGGSARSVASWAPVAGDPTRLNLTLSGSAPTSSQAVTLRYTDLSSANDLTGVVQDTAGNDMATIAAPGLTATTFSSSASVASLASTYANLTLTGTAATATANSGNNRIRANQPTAVVNIFTGGDGIDDMDAAAGSDIYIIASAAHHSAAEIGDSGSGATDIDELRFSSITTGETLSVFAGDSGLERIAIGTGIAANPVTTATTALSINAAAAPNRLTITGNNGPNTLIGTAFNDILIGNGGNDAMDGRDGSDTYRITNSSERSAAEINDTGTGAGDIDELRFASTTANQTLILYAGDLGLESVVIEPGLVALKVNAAAAPNGLSITGNDAANLIVTTAYADLLDGRGGNDIYLVNSPAHRPAGESITDTGAAGIDELRFASITNGDTITINASDSGLERVTLGTGTAAAAVLTAATSLHINAAAATSGLSLQGNYGFNTITGSSFNDLLNGNRGNDTLTGGAGADTFRFDSALNATTNRDTITDFNPAEDRIELAKSVFSALMVPAGPLAAIAFHVGSSPTTTDHRILYNNLTGTLTYDSNGSGSGGSTVFAVLPLGLGGSMHAGIFSIT
jgi:Ca2+-binding RTX toxin-like protein